MQRDPLPLPPMPNLGPTSAIPDPNDPEGYLLNIAGVIAIASECETPQSERVYRSFCAAWDRIRLSPGTEAQKQGFALQEAFASIGTNIVLTNEPLRS